MSTAVDFEAYGRPLDTVTKFKYLVRIIMELDDDWPAFVANLRKARKQWARISSFLRPEGEVLRTSGTF